MFQAGERRRTLLISAQSIPRIDECENSMADETREFRYEVENGCVINSADTNRFRSARAGETRGASVPPRWNFVSYRKPLHFFSNCRRRSNRPRLVTYEWCSCGWLFPVLTGNASLRGLDCIQSLHPRRSLSCTFKHVIDSGLYISTILSAGGCILRKVSSICDICPL